MKLVKKVLMGLSIFALVLSLTGCPKINDFLEDDDQADTDAIENTSIIKGTAGNATVDFANATDKNAREMVTLVTKHYGSRAKIVQTNIDTNLAHGIQGFVFNVVKHNKGDKIGATENTYEKNTLDFMVVSVGYAGKPIYYISAYRNITDLNAINFGVTDAKTFKTGKETQFMAETAPTEFEVVAIPVKTTNNSLATDPRKQNLEDGYYTFTEGTDENGNVLTVAINVVAEEDGSYTVQFYNPEDVIKENGSWVSSLKLKDFTPKEVKISNALTGYTEKQQTLIGVYTNVYPYHVTANDDKPEFKLKGSWRLSGIKGEAEVAEFED